MVRAVIKKDPVCGMPGSLEAHDHYFCSKGCIKNYEKQLKGKKLPWYKERVWIVSFITLAILTAAYFIPSLSPVLDAFLDYLGLIWWAILLGFLIGGLIDHFVPQNYISKFLARSEKRTILYATGLGFIMAACSHGILAIAIELYKKGASVPSVIAFLLASPWANLPITFMLFGFFGFKAFYLIISAVIVAIITGLIYQALDRKGWIEPAKSVKVEKGFSIRRDIRRRWSQYSFGIVALKRDVSGVLSGGWNLAKMVLWWILIGMMIASFARAFVPMNVFQDYLGATVLGLILTLIIATIIEVCSEGSSPMAFEIYNQTGAFGNSFVFLMAGVATDYTEIGLIWSNIGKKAALWLPVVTIPQILFLGYLFNSLL